MISRRQTAARAFGAALRAARLDQGISQMNLAEAGDFDPTYISLLERARRVPSFFAIVRLAEGLQISPVRLFADSVGRITDSASVSAAALFRVAYLLPDGRLAEAEPIYTDLRAAILAAELENATHTAVSDPELTHVVEYVRAGALDLRSRKT
jgi:XRE family transcriptional regulator, regulator of sulfur utilization